MNDFMNAYQEGFKNDILNASFKLTKKIWLKVTLGYTIQSVLVLMILIPALFFLFNVDLTFLQQVSEGGTAAAEIMREYLESIEPAQFLTFRFIGIVIVVFIAILLITSWGYNLYFILSDKEIRQQVVNFPQALSESFNQNIFKLMAAGILVGLIFMGGMAIIATVTGFSTFFGIVLFLGIIVLFCRFILTFPAIVHENRTIGDAISFSFRNITWARALKVAGVGILIFIALIVISLIVAATLMIFNFIPIIGPILNQVLNILFGGLVTAFFITLISGLYFRYASPIEEDESNLEEHLITDE